MAVSLSDLASCAATPAFITLNLTLPTLDETWLKAFSRGLFECADAFNVKLVGGDTCKGPLTITVTANGYIDKGSALTRCNARAGDSIYITGHLRDAALYLTGKLTDAASRQQLDRPTPRVETGLALKNIASSCIDISDGLLQDLGHILNQSGVGAELFHSPLSKKAKKTNNAMQTALTGGDDYELCFTAPQDKKLLLPHHVIEIGKITSLPGYQFTGELEKLNINTQGYKHF